MRGIKDSFIGAEFNVFAYSPLEEALSLVVARFSQGKRVKEAFHGGWEEV
jgi:hypothetical protein